MKNVFITFQKQLFPIKREKNIYVFNVFIQVGVKQLTDFLRTVTAASDLVDCTLVYCVTCVGFGPRQEHHQMILVSPRL